MKIYKVKVNGKTYEVQLESVDEVKTEAAVPSETKTKEAPKKETSKKASSSSSTNLVEVVAPIQGNVIDVKVKVGDKVKKGDVLLLIEAMKLENEVNSPCDGEVAEVIIAKGQQVTTKQLLIKIK
ncbi:MAG: biotin/lipoyl-containing protein [Bacilli bacterium]